MSDHHSHRHVVPKNSPRSVRRPATGSFPAERTRGLTEALLEALEKLERAKLQTTGRTNPEDDDEDPTRRG